MDVKATAAVAAKVALVQHGQIYPRGFDSQQLDFLSRAVSFS